MPVLSQKVLTFARKNLGNKVGRGECWDLADEALEKAGAKCSHDFGKVTPTANYQWGQAVDLSQAKAGDIIQYRDFKWVRRITKKDGGWKEDYFAFPHHTAILASNKEGGLWEVYEQNIRDIKSVMLNSIYLEATTFTDSRGNQVRVKISGKFWIYRPQAK